MPAIFIPALAAAASTAIPIAITGGIGALFTSTALSTILTAAIGGALSAIASGALSGSSSPDVQPSLLVRQGTQFGQFVYGRGRVQRSGVTYAENNGGDLWVVVPVACHEINRFVEIYDGDDRMWTEGVGPRGEYADGRLEVYTRLGTDNQTHVPELIAAVAALDSNFRGRGIAYIVLCLKDFANKWNNQTPQLWVEVEGAIVDDPRTSTRVYSANWALCVNHYLTATRGGPGLTRVNDAALIASANLCDEWVADEGTFDGTAYAVWDRQQTAGVWYHRRYEINGSFGSDVEPLRILALMEPYGVGNIVWSQGEYHIKAGAYSAPVAAYTEADLIETPAIGGNVRIEEQVHGVRGQYADPSANYRVTDFPEVLFSGVTPPASEAANYYDAELSREIHPERATRLAVLAARSFFRFGAANLALGLSAIAHEAGDRITFQFDAISLNSPYQISEVRLDLNPEKPAVRVSCIEDGTSFWTWSSDTASVVPVSQSLGLPSSSTVIAPISLTLTAASFMGPDGITNGAIGATWPVSTDFYVSDYEVQWTVGGNVVGTTRTGGAARHVITGLNIGDDVTVDVFAVNGRGRKSTAVSGTFTVTGDNAAPAVPTGWSGEAGFRQITLRGPKAGEADFKAFRVYGATAAGSPIFLFAHAGNEIQRYVGSTDIYVRYKITAEDHAGNESAVGSSAWIDIVPVLPGVGDLSQGVWDQVAQDATDIAAVLVAALETEFVLPTIRVVRQQSVDLTQVADQMAWLTDRLRETDGRMADAGIYVDPSSGLVRIAAIESVNDRVGAAEIRVSAAEASITLKASVAYVDTAISEAVLDPTQVPIIADLQLQIQTAEADIDALEAQIVLKATTATVDGIDVRLVTAEADIDALEGSIVTKVEVSTFDSLETRVTTTETELNALDGAAITQTVIDTRALTDEIEIASLNNLAELLAAYTNREALRLDVALVQQEITALVTSDRVATASSLITIQAVIDGNAAAIITEQTARADADSALTTLVTTAQAAADSNAAAIVVEQTVRADADSALTSSITTLTSTVGTNTASITTNLTSINGVRNVYGVRSDLNGHVSGFGLISDLVDGNPVSNFIVVADRFSVVAPDGSNTSAPFVIYTSATVVNGVTLPAGAYMEGASIRDLGAVTGTIGTLRTKTTGERVEISDDVIKVFDASNNVRVKLGDLT